MKIKKGITRKGRLLGLGTIGVLLIGGGLLANKPESAAAEKGPQAKYDVEVAPKWTDAGELMLPGNFREDWVFIGSPITPDGLNGGHANFPEFHNVYVQREAFIKYRKTNKWPEGTMMLKELQRTSPGDGPNGSKTEPSGTGYFPGGPNGVDISVKDSTKFPKSKNWGFFNFGHHKPPYAASAKEQPLAKCAGCHIANAPEDMVYVDFYKPILDPLPAPTNTDAGNDK